MQALLAASHAYGSYVAPGALWTEGAHLKVNAETVPAPPADVSALFALHRRLAMGDGPVTLARGAEHEAIFRGLGLEPATQFLCAAPVRGGAGRVLGAIVLAAASAPQLETSLATLAEVAKLASTASEGSRQLLRARKEQERLQLLSEASHEALWDWDVKRDVVWWGGGVQSLLGAGEDTEPRGSSWRLERLHPEDARRVEHGLRGALGSSASAWREEYRFRRQDGSWLTVEERAYFLRDADSRAYRVIGSIRDISQLKVSLHSERQARAEAEAANRAKDEFLAMLSHELRNPLAPIIAALDLMRLGGETTAERARAVIDRQARHLVRLVEDLMDISRITRGKIELVREPVLLRQVVARAVEMTQPLFDERRHRLTTRIEPGDLVVNVDSSRMAQVLSNLLNNAATYTPPGGQVALKAEPSAEGGVTIRVADSGAGIDPAMLSEVFGMFVQQPQAPDRAQGGLGLGLAIVRNLVELHGGQVSAHSAGGGRGAEFVIQLPPYLVPPPEGLEASSPRTTTNAPRPARVLLVDDNQDAADTLAELLEDCGYSCSVAYDGPSALEAARRFQPSVAILDIGLPVMDGYELAQRLRSEHSAVRLVALTGYGQEKDRRAAREAKFDRHLMKPAEPERLRQVLSELLLA
ncbi:MAG: PAS domain-containing hybrid sensor histidine kinase/response regulator [Myxococcales bacterium]|nr:MAG: PAS domain-containing hybrid sensor histidine kinase/response regulator [Myxococcales bacterium]